MKQPASPALTRNDRRHQRTPTTHPSGVVVEAIVNAGRWLCNVVAEFSAGPDFVLINIAGRLPEHHVHPQGWRGWLQRRFNPPRESLQVWRERLQLLSDDPKDDDARELVIECLENLAQWLRHGGVPSKLGG